MNMVIEAIRKQVKKLVDLLAGRLNDLTGGKLNPNSITITGFLLHIPIAVFIGQGKFVLAGLLLIVFGLFDALDGSLARLQKRSSNFGMFLDSVTDRMKEVIIYIGIAYYFASVFEVNLLVWTVAAAGASVIISYVNAWAEVTMSRASITDKHTKNKSFRSGMMSFDVRMFLLIVGLLFNVLPLVVVAIALLAPLTIIDRLFLIARKIR